METQITANVGVGGHFCIEKLKNGKVIDTHSFNNLIVDTGLEMLINAGYYYQTTCHVGTGSAPEQVSDVRLQTRLASKSAFESYTGGIS